MLFQIVQSQNKLLKIKQTLSFGSPFHSINCSSIQIHFNKNSTFQKNSNNFQLHLQYKQMEPYPRPERDLVNYWGLGIYNQAIAQP